MKKVYLIFALVLFLFTISVGQVKAYDYSCQAIADDDWWYGIRVSSPCAPASDFCFGQGIINGCRDNCAPDCNRALRTYDPAECSTGSGTGVYVQCPPDCEDYELRFDSWYYDSLLSGGKSERECYDLRGLCGDAGIARNHQCEMRDECDDECISTTTKTIALIESRWMGIFCSCVIAEEKTITVYSSANEDQPCTMSSGESGTCQSCQCVPTPSPCDDTDMDASHPDGKNYFQKGTCTDGTGSYTDSCGTGNVLTEWYCSGTSCVSTTYDCDNKDCTTGITCSISTDKSTLYKKGDNYACGNGECYKLTTKKTCDSWTCDASKAGTTQSCGGTTYYCCEVDGSYQWQTSSCSVNHPPSVTLISPDDGATISDNKVNLKVTVDDDDGDTLLVTWYGKKVGGSWEPLNQDNLEPGTTAGYMWSDLDWGATYYWKVEACDNYICVNSSSRMFQVELDSTSPSVSVTGAPSDWSNSDATADVSCSDTQSGCDESSYRLETFSTEPESCPQSYSQYTLTPPQTISSHVWVCGAAKDNINNDGFSTPVEFKIDKTAPYISSINPESSD